MVIGRSPKDEIERVFPRENGIAIMRKFVVICGFIVLAGGCGGDDATSDPPSAAVADTDPEPAAPSDSDSVVAIELAPCDLVTSEDVAAVTGLTAVTTGADPVLGPNGCVFDVGLSADVFVSIDDGQGRMTSPAAMFGFYMDDVSDGAAQLIPELGSPAVYSSGFRALAVDAADGRFFAVGLSGGYPDEFAEPREILVTLAAAALERL
jgi:hypothetical protein